MEPLQRLLHQRSEAFFSNGPDLGDLAALRQLQTWHCFTGCSAHDIQNSLKWALAAHTTEALLKDIHITLESLRNSFALLHGSLPAFLVQRLAFDMPPGPTQDIMEFWQLLGVEADVLEEVSVVNPWFSDGLLHVSADLADGEDSLDRISSVVLCLFRWRRFVESRFDTVGPAMRSLAASLSVGLTDLVGHTRANPKCTDFHLHGFARLTETEREYMVIAAACSWVPDAALYLVLEDDRVLRRREELRTTLLEELSYLGSLGASTWRRLAQLISADYSPEALKNTCLLAANVANAYIQDKALGFNLMVSCRITFVVFFPLHLFSLSFFSGAQRAGRISVVLGSG